MAVRDTDISDWSTTTADNLPEDGTLIGRDLSDQFRNIKSVVRSESLNKQWMKLSDLITTTSSSARFTAQFETTAGDLTAYFPDSRKVRLISLDETATIYCGVIASTYALSRTSMTLIALDGAVENATEYQVAIGTEDPSKSHLPTYAQETTVTISGANTSGAATFTRTEPDTSYFVKTTVISCNSATAGANVVKSTTKNSANCVIGLAAAPGGATQTVIGCLILRTF